MGFVLAHTCAHGCNIAQTSIGAPSFTEALALFGRLYAGRLLSVAGWAADQARREVVGVPGVCNRAMRDGCCNMDAGHRGRCTTVAWTCDGCGQTRRSAVAAWARDGEYERGLGYCFMCANGIG